LYQNEKKKSDKIIQNCQIHNNLFIIVYIKINWTEKIILIGQLI
jgi:hypothetical protein